MKNYPNQTEQWGSDYPRKTAKLLHRLCILNWQNYIINVHTIALYLIRRCQKFVPGCKVYWGNIIYIYILTHSELESDIAQSLNSYSSHTFSQYCFYHLWVKQWTSRAWFTWLTNENKKNFKLLYVFTYSLIVGETVSFAFSENFKANT